MTEAVEFDWLRWRDTPPGASCIPVEVVCDGWTHIRLWRPSSLPPDDVTPGLLWRPCGREMLRLALEGGVYGAEGEALYGSPPLVVNTADPNGPWPHMFVLRPPQWPDCGPPGRLWLVPPCGDLVEWRADCDAWVGGWASPRAGCAGYRNDGRLACVAAAGPKSMIRTSQACAFARDVLRQCRTHVAFPVYKKAPEPWMILDTSDT